MLIQITITIPPSGIAGPFDLFSDADGYVSPFETQVPAVDLEAGYVVELPVGATIIRVCSVGDCENCIDLPTNCTTTTTTSSSSTTTTSTSSSTTTSTTTGPPPYKFDWELITGTPSFIGTVNLEVFVDGVSTVDATISQGNTTQSGQLMITAGQVVTATMTSIKTGTFNFGNKVVKDAALYQPNDDCMPCVDQLVTPLFNSYTMGSANTQWIFQGDVNPPTTTTTSSSSTSSTTSTTSTSSTSSTTTTTTTCDCSLNGLTAQFVQPVTTTTSTTPGGGGNIDPGALSSVTNPSACDCFLTLDSICYIQHAAINNISVGDRIFNDSSGNNPVNGNLNYYKVQLNTNSSRYSLRIDGNGFVLSPICLCP
jgi:hypothetical protein